jgi:hypothetical protein
MQSWAFEVVQKPEIHRSLGRANPSLLWLLDAITHADHRWMLTEECYVSGGGKEGGERGREEEEGMEEGEVHLTGSKVLNVQKPS